MYMFLLIVTKSTTSRHHEVNKTKNEAQSRVSQLGSFIHQQTATETEQPRRRPLTFERWRRAATSKSPLLFDRRTRRSTQAYVPNRQTDGPTATYHFTILFISTIKNIQHRRPSVHDPRRRTRKHVAVVVRRVNQYHAL